MSDTITSRMLRAIPRDYLKDSGLDNAWKDWRWYPLRLLTWTFTRSHCYEKLDHDDNYDKHCTVSVEERAEAVFVFRPEMRFKANSRRDLCMSASPESGRTPRGRAPSGLIHAQVSFLETRGEMDTKGFECG